MQFSPLTTSALILGPIRYFFSTYAGPEKLHWSPDPKETEIEIDYYNNLHKVAIQQRPRILVDRGGYIMNKTGVTDSMAQGLSHKESRGLDDRKNFILYQGQATIIVEARQQGVCELITDMVSHFIAWARPMLCDTQGFKELGMPMQVGPCQLLDAAEDDHKFQVAISIPYIKEEHWHVRNDGIILKDINAFIEQAKHTCVESTS